MRRETSGALDAAVRYFTRDTGIMDGMLLVCGTESRELAALDGEVRENSVFDLASLTKLLSYYVLREGIAAGEIKNSDTVRISDHAYAVSKTQDGIVPMP